MIFKCSLDNIYKSVIVKIIMKRGWGFVLIIAFVFAISFVFSSQIENSLHLNIQVTNSSNNDTIITGTFNFVFNLSTTQDCANSVYSNSSTLTTDSRGGISYYLENMNLNFSDQYWLCYYRNGVLINSSKIAYVPYAFMARNVSLSGVYVDTNFGVGNYNITTTGVLSSPMICLNGVCQSAWPAAGGNPFNQDLNTTANAFFVSLNIANNFYANSTNVGIGTTSPKQVLDVVGSIGLGLNATNNYGRLYFYSGTSAVAGVINRGTASSDLYFGETADTGEYIFRSSGATTFEGNVGIGTASPTVKLSVNGSVSIGPQDSTQEGGQINWNPANGGFAQWYQDIYQNRMRFWANTTGSGDTLVLTNTGDVAIAGSAMYAKFNGNVGIGTTTPSQKLFIAGNLSVQGEGGYNEAGERGIVYLGDTNAYITSVFGSGVRIGAYNVPDAITLLQSSGNVGIGTSSPTAKLMINGSLRVQNSSGTLVLYVNDSTGKVGINTTNPLATLSVGGTGTTYATGIYAESPDGGIGYGIWGNASQNTGVYGTGSTGVSGIGAAYGTQGTCTNNGGTCYGIYGSGGSYAGTGVYGRSDAAFGLGVYGYAPGATSTGVKGYGTSYDFYATGSGTDYGTSSSIRWKDNITEITNALDKILNLKGVYFNWKIYNGSHDMGFIAEDVGKVVPEVVQYETNLSNSSNYYIDANGKKQLYATGVDYGALTPMLVEAIKEQQKIILSQNNTINRMKASLCKLGAKEWC